MSQTVLVERSGLSQKTIQRIERDHERVTKENKAIVASVLGIPYDPEKDKAAPVRRGPPPGQRFKNMRTVSIPVFNVSIPAGRWADEAYPLDSADADDWIPIPANKYEGSFALRIHGDCMEPEYPDGTSIVFVPIRIGEPNALQFEDGRDYYFQHSDGRATFKRVFYEHAKDRYKLVPLNKKYTPFYVPYQECARLNRAVMKVNNLL